MVWFAEALPPVIIMRLEDTKRGESGKRTNANRAGDPNFWVVMGCGTGDEEGEVIDAILK